MKNFTLLLSLLFVVVSLQAQDYLISFAGKGASTSIDNIQVENLTQNKRVSLSGTEVLHLVATNTGINPILDIDDALRIYPNPTNGYSIIDFVATAFGTTKIELFDITGKRVVSDQNTLTVGTHSYQISGLGSGIYTVKIYSQAFTYTGKLVCNGEPNSNAKINYIGNIVIPVTAEKLKSASAEKIMQYTTGDRLKITSKSGNYSTIITDVPTQSKTITFTFVPCTDGDGNNYPVVQIGTQIWMAENLKTTKYNNGDPITNVTDNTAWGNLTTGAQCSFNNDASIGNKYGKLYNWFAVNDSRNIPPPGWHVPTGVEWTRLENYLIANLSSYGPIVNALAAKTDWASSTYEGTVGYNLNKNNNTGFTALPGGYRDDSEQSGAFYGINKIGGWWSSTEGNNTHAWCWYTFNDDGDLISDYDYSMECGFSVRCVYSLSLYEVVPTVISKVAESMTLTSAICGGNITSDGSSTVTARGVCWGTSPNPTIANSKTVDGTGIGSYTSSITGLTANTTYYLRAYATNSTGTGYGNQVNFTITSGITGGTVTDIDGNVYHTVTIGTKVWMVENLKTTKYRNSEPIPNITDGTEWGKLSTGAQCNFNNNAAYGSIYGKLYNWYAVNDSRNIAPTGWHIATDAEWTMLTNYVATNLGPSSSVAKALASKTDWYSSTVASAVGNDLTKNNTSGFTALPGGFRNPDGTFYEFGYACFWWSPAEFDKTRGWDLRMGYNDGNLGSYHNDKKSGSSVRCIRDALAPNAVVPTVITTAVGNITPTSAISGGNITSDGGASVMASGVCWSTSQNPTIANSKTSSVTGIGTGSFTSSLTNLTAGTIYYVRSYATNSVGTAYGKQVSFTTTITNAEVPTVITIAVSNITTTSVISGGNITSDGGASVTVSGVCWSTSQNPTIANSKTTSVTGAGSFTSSITGLTANTLYYARAYASNSQGTAYGNQVIFTTEAGVVPIFGFLTDPRDGHKYKTVTLGTQMWMAENLAYLPTVSPPLYSSATTPYYYVYDYTGTDVAAAKATDNYSTYGVLYNWPAALAACPPGWHLPSDAEWTALTTFLGGESVAGGKLKETGTTHWNSPNTGATNEKGFAALPAGYCGDNGKFNYIGYYGYWWSSTENDIYGAWWSRLMYCYSSDVIRNYNYKEGGFSVRCIKD